MTQTPGHTAGSSALVELAGRVEGLAGPCRETDLAIELAIRPSGKIAGLVRLPRGFDGRDSALGYLSYMGSAEDIAALKALGVTPEWLYRKHNDAPSRAEASKAALSPSIEQKP